MVTFHYNKHEDNSFVKKTLPAIDFIKLLILHIPEKNFKMTRYYGLYARHREIDNQLHKAVPKSKHRILLDFNTWRKLFLLTMGYDPLQCPNCRHEMVFLELYHKHERVVYVSCGPDTLARDLGVFRKLGYEAKGAWPVDMFPGSVHTEVVIQMTFCGCKQKNDI